jgi:hypothetical protein
MPIGVNFTRRRAHLLCRSAIALAMLSVPAVVRAQTAEAGG